MMKKTIFTLLAFLFIVGTAFSQTSRLSPTSRSGGTSSGGGATTAPVTPQTTPTLGSTIPANASQLPWVSNGSMNLTVLALNSTHARLSWTLPPRFNPTSITITYMNSYDTVSYSVSTSSRNSFILRSLPVGAFEEWKIVATQAGGAPMSDNVRRDAHYGGVVLVVDDVIFSRVTDICNETPEGYDTYYYVKQCIVSPIDRSCFHSDTYLHGEIVTPGDENAEQTYTDDIIASLETDMGSSSTGVTNCDGMEPDWYTDDPINSGGGGRAGTQEAVVSIQAKVFPNPFQGRFSVETYDVEGNATLMVHNLQGQIVHSEELDLIGGTEKLSVNTDTWAPGLYQVSLVHDSGRFTQKVVKH